MKILLSKRKVSPSPETMREKIFILMTDNQLIMRHLISIFLFFLLINPNKGISQTITEVENKQLAGILTFIAEMKDFNNDNFAVKVFKVGLPADTMPNSKSEEIYNRILISVSEAGEYPKYKVYELAELYNADQIVLHNVDPFIERVEFVYGRYKQRKLAVLEINAKALSVVRIQ